MQQQDTENPKLKGLRKLAWLLDNSISIPGTRWKIGLDAIIGLIPGAGDIIGVILSLYIVVNGAKLGASGGTLFRMLINIGVEALVGMVPVVGDLFDAGWKANHRNFSLLEKEFGVGFAEPSASAPINDTPSKSRWPVVTIGIIAAIGYIALMGWILWYALNIDIVDKLN